VAGNILSIIPHGIRVEASLYLELVVIGWRQSITTGETVREKVVVWQFTQVKNGLLAGDNPVFDTSSTDIDMEMKKAAEEMTLH